jgi:RNA polymerase sigma-70 factor, ECF subfamily
MDMTASVATAVQAGSRKASNERHAGQRIAMSDASRAVDDTGPDPASKIVLGVDALFRQYARFVATFLVRLGTPPQDLDDLVQEVFLVAHRLGGFTPDAAKPTTWLAMIALRVASGRRRTRRRHPEVLDETNIECAAATSPNQEDIVRATQSLTLVGRALEALDIEKRALFILFEIEEQSCESIAADLGIPIVTVYSRLKVARQEFRREYARLTRDPRSGRPRQ